MVFILVCIDSYIWQPLFLQGLVHTNLVSRNVQERREAAQVGTALDEEKHGLVATEQIP